MEICYCGWSGVAIRHGGVLVGVDLFGEGAGWELAREASATILCLTHGHPEHCGSLRRLLASAGAGPYLATTHLVASSPVAHYVTKAGTLPPERVHRVTAGARVNLPGVQVTTFRWRHFPLLPPGAGAKARYLSRLLARPLGVARIGLASLGLPLWSPMLGFHLRFADGRTLLNYAEGLHRATDPGEVAAVAGTLPAGILVFAVEPEDVQVIPRWVERLAPTAVFLYEAHRPWREQFRLPYVDLEAYAKDLTERFRGLACRALTRVGQVVTVEPAVTGAP